MNIHGKELIKNFVLPVWNHRTVELIEQFCHEDIVVKTPLFQSKGIKDFKKHLNKTFTALLNYTLDVNQLFSHPNLVICEWSGKAIHVGPLLGLPASKKILGFQGIDLLRFDHNGVYEWISFSSLPQILIKARDAIEKKVCLNSNDVIQTLRTTLEVKMTRREVETLELWLRGFSIQEMASLLGGLSPRTIQTFRENIKKKLRVSTYQELISLLKAGGLLGYLMGQ